MPGGTAHTAGGTPADDNPSYFDAVKSLGKDYYLNFHRRPCVRDSQLTGIGSGFAFGGLAAVLRKPVYICCTYAWFGWIWTSVAAYQYCQWQRSREKAGMTRAMEIMEQKRADIEAKREARRRAKEAADRAEEGRRREEERRKTWGYWFNKNIRFW
ncbi:hypothetical protein K469DRAFT_696310 [Zopfia rhizophila CBS 207.26]|uniref:Cytochrome c oxidase assembly protein COX20, mitochondrial n=1 Tax=Zopfia rhizophila CBS 207.26 TaxID=1314779 RepID=A0A6A6DK23_9PEZI|nr:hypothetical protein K469DRAFT_696310 [Zopfia rhizophila CBS 207.26]